MAKDFNTPPLYEKNDSSLRNNEVLDIAVFVRMHSLNGKEFDCETDGDRDGHDSSSFDEEMCWCCKHVVADKTLASKKCHKCVWPLQCSLQSCNKGFCSACVDNITTDHDAYKHQDIPRRLHPDGSGELLEYDDLHPFLLCDCGICAWCGEDTDDCCQDRIYQHCSCFP